MWESAEPEVWRICLDGRVQEDWADWFTWASVRCVACHGGGWQTVAEGELHDRGALRGLIVRLLDRNVSVASIDRISDPRRREDMLASTIESWR